MRAFIRKNFSFFLETPLVMPIFALAIIIPIRLFIFVLMPGDDNRMMLFLLISIVLYFIGYFSRTQLFNRRNNLSSNQLPGGIIVEYFYFITNVMFLILLGIEVASINSEIFDGLSSLLVSGMFSEQIILDDITSLAGSFLYIYSVVFVVWFVFSIPIMVYINLKNKLWKAGSLSLIISLVITFLIGTYSLENAQINIISDFIYRLRILVTGPAILYYFLVVTKGSSNLRRYIYWVGFNIRKE